MEFVMTHFSSNNKSAWGDVFVHYVSVKSIFFVHLCECLLISAGMPVFCKGLKSGHVSLIIMPHRWQAANQHCQLRCNQLSPLKRFDMQNTTQSQTFQQSLVDY